VKHKVLLVLLSTIVTIVVFELALGLFDTLGLFPNFYKRLAQFDPSFEPGEATALYYSHPYVSYEMKPGYQRKGKAHINALGFRGDPIEPQKPAGRYRIVAIGDSTTYGIFNEYDDTFPAQLERELDAQLSTDRVEVINAGLVSATSAESFVRFYMRVLPLQPDMVVLYGALGDVFPRVFDNYSEDYLHFRRAPETTRSLLSHSYLASLVRQAVLARFLPDAGLRNGNLLEYTWRWENLPKDEARRIANFEATTAKVFKRNLKYIIDGAIANGVKPVLVTFGYNPEKSNWNDDIPSQIWGPGIEQNNAAIRELAGDYRLPLCDFNKSALDTPKAFEDSIHLSKRGNRKLAECITEAVKPLVRDALQSGGEIGLPSQLGTPAERANASP
jgi:lysophospholipase L1-like esterase